MIDSLAKKEMIWLAGNTFYGRKQIFSPEFLAWLEDFRLPEYELRRVDGQYELHFHGPWTHTMMWEIPALAIVNELRSRAALRLPRQLPARRRSSRPAGRPSRATHTTVRAWASAVSRAQNTQPFGSRSSRVT